MSVAIKIEDISKQYRLGHVGTGSFSNDLNSWWAKVRGKENPYLKVGELNDRTQKGNSNYIWALKDINFEVQKGEMIGIIGRNGAGKSTLLKVLSRITQPTTGSLKINGRISSLLEVGTGFHPDLTGRENVFLNGTILGMKKSEIQTKFDEIIDFAGVERFIDTPVKRYSSGMYVRLAFAVAAHLQPEILIIDEVLAVGDNEFQRKSIAKMEEICKSEGKTLIFVSHNTAAIERLCHKCVYLKHGELAGFGSTEKMLIEYNRDNYNSDNSIDNFAGFQNKLEPSIGNFKVRVKDFLMYRNNETQPVSQFFSGDTVRIVIKYENQNYEGKLIKVLNFGMPIFNANQQFMTVLNSKMALKTFNNAPLNGEILCEIPNLPLMVGTFFMVIYLMVDGEIAEQINGIKIHVLENDFYGSGFPNSLGRQGVYIPQNWSEIK